MFAPTLELAKRLLDEEVIDQVAYDRMKAGLIDQLCEDGRVAGGELGSTFVRSDVEDGCICSMKVYDVRFPTSDGGHGSDAIHKDPDYSCVYVELETKGATPLEGFGLTFSLGRGNEVTKLCVEAFADSVLGTHAQREIFEDMAGFTRKLCNDGQLRWLGPDKGVVAMACGAILNAAWDMWARSVGKPLWLMVSDLTPEQVMATVDFQYLEDAAIELDAEFYADGAAAPEYTDFQEVSLEILRAAQDGDVREGRIAEMKTVGFPCYTTSLGWLGYTDEYIKDVSVEYLSNGYTRFKMKVGADIEDDIRRAKYIRSLIGGPEKCVLAMDANQRWGVDQCVGYMKRLAFASPLWIEEPTSPDDVLAHRRIRDGLAREIPECKIGVASGEVMQNKVLWKQLFQQKGVDFAQIDSCRMAGVGEIIAVMLMAKSHGVPIVPHAGGVGLCEYVRHLAMIDYVCVNGNPLSENVQRMSESTTHLHEFFEDTEDFIVNGHYRAPSAPGYARMTRAAIEEYAYPNGSLWLKRLSGAK
jgi:L-fuconate dehydratase|tara:strand:- start:1405 stop:2988 length:1584 start_codon:yes stop_codon:yes gene_type:complete